jgi:hypothetical protein
MKFSFLQSVGYQEIRTWKRISNTRAESMRCDFTYPTDCQLSTIHDYSYCFIAYPTVYDTAQRREFWVSYKIVLKHIWNKGRHMRSEARKAIHSPVRIKCLVNRKCILVEL